MRTSYAVFWRENNGPVCSGELDLTRDRLRLEGASREGGSSMKELLYRDIQAVRIGRLAGERLAGRASVIVSDREQRILLITSLTGLGMNREIEERLSAGRPGVAPT